MYCQLKKYEVLLLEKNTQLLLVMLNAHLPAGLPTENRRSSVGVYCLPTENRRSSVGVYQTSIRSSVFVCAIPAIKNLNRR